MSDLDIIEKRRKTMINITYFAMFIVLYYLFVKFAFWMVSPFIFAFLIAIILQRPIRFISRKTPLGSKAVSVVLVLLLIIAVAAIAVLVGYALVNEFIEFFNFLKAKLSNGTAFIENIRNSVDGVLVRLPKSLSDYLRNSIDGMTASILKLSEETEASASAASSGGLNLSILKTPLAGLLTTAKQIPVILAAFLVGVVACVFMTSDYKAFTGLIKNSISDEHEASLVRAKHIITDVLGKWCKSYAILLFITFCEVSVGLGLLKLFGLYKGGYIIVIAICTALLDILPVFGTGTVMIPWALVCIFTHKVGLGIGLIALYVIITVIRQIIEPKIVSSNVDMHPVITLMCMFVGVQVFGVLGIFILPMTMVVIKTLNDEGVIHIWRNKKKEAELAAAEEEAQAESEAPAEAESPVQAKE